MTPIKTIYINPLLRNLIASGYETHFGISRKRALGIVLAFIDPRMDSASSFSKRGVWMDRVVQEAPGLFVRRIQKQAELIEGAGGNTKPTPRLVYTVMLEAIKAYNEILAGPCPRPETFFRRHHDGRIEFITGSDHFKMSLLCSVNPSDFDRVFRRVHPTQAGPELSLGVSMSRERPWYPIIKEKDEYGTVLTQHDISVYAAFGGDAQMDRRNARDNRPA